MKEGSSPTPFLSIDCAGIGPAGKERLPQPQLGHSDLGQLKLRTKVIGLLMLASRAKGRATPPEYDSGDSRMLVQLNPEFPVSWFFLGVMFFMRERTPFRAGLTDDGTVQKAWTQMLDVPESAFLVWLSAPV